MPAAEAEFPLFEQVLAEIGDQQSIQESLSSFSGHIARVREMLETVTPQSLVLLDELGRATDPEEGGPLGVAILESFRAHGAFTFASTHLLALKIFGATTEGVVNASMGFDEKTLQPTYVLQLGAPGKSAGLEIASRLGLSEDLIARARQRMSTSERDIAVFLNELHQRLRRTAVEEQDLREQRQALEAREQTLAKEFEQREKAKFKELDERLRSALAEFEAQTQETIQKVLAGAEQRKAAEQAERRVAKTKREFEEKARVAVFGEAPAPTAAFHSDRGRRASPAEGRSRTGAGAAQTFGRIARSGSGLDEDESDHRRRGGGFACGAREHAITEECFVRGRAALGCHLSRNQRHRKTSRRGSRGSGQVSGHRFHGVGGSRAHRARPRHGYFEESDRRIAGNEPACGEVLSSHAGRRRNGRDGGGVKIEIMQLVSPLTIDDFERLPDELAYYHELVDGELVDVSGNTPDHNWSPGSADYDAFALMSKNISSAESSVNRNTISTGTLMGRM